MNSASGHQEDSFLGIKKYIAGDCSIFLHGCESFISSKLSLSKSYSLYPPSDHPFLSLGLSAREGAHCVDKK
jgi:hypothetical protein